jgi:hypothetical protein
MRRIIIMSKPKSTQKAFSHFLSLAGLVIISFSALSCKKNDQDALQEAQYCLNKAAPSEAKACVSGVAGLGNQNSFKLMCAAVFISEGFGSPSSFATAISQISNPTPSEGCSGSDCSGSLNAMNVLNFGTNTVSADEAVSYCSRSGVVSYAQMSSMFSIGTQMKIALNTLYGPGVTPTAGQLEAAVDAIPPATLGDIVVSTFGASCSDLTNASDETKKYCADLSVAMSATGGNSAAIGACFQARMKDPALVTCP